MLLAGRAINKAEFIRKRSGRFVITRLLRGWPPHGFLASVLGGAAGEAARSDGIDVARSEGVHGRR